MDNNTTIHKLQDLILEHYLKVEKRRTSLIEDQLRWKSYKYQLQLANEREVHKDNIDPHYNPGGMEWVDVAANVARLPEEVLSNWGLQNIWFR